jgi:mannose-1-phosphate guanylyltransferase
MKAMILAAGKGTRVQPITHEVPKPMIPLVRKPVLESIIELLRQHGVDRIVINTSHLAPAIEGYFRDGGPWGVDIAYSFEGHMEAGEIRAEALGSAGGMKRIQDFSGFFDDTFVVLCGDALIDLDIGVAVAFHKAKGALATIVMQEVPREDVYKYGVVQTDGEGRILQFQEKPDPAAAVSTTINTGIYVFEPQVFDYIPSGQTYDIGGQLFPDLARRGLPFFGVALPFQWLDIGSLSDYWHATRAVLQGHFAGYRLPGHDQGDGLRLGINVRMDRSRVRTSGPIYIGNSCNIGPGTVIEGPTVIGAGCIIESGAEIRQCLIGDYTRIGSVARLDQVVVANGHCIRPDGTFFSHKAADLAWLIDDARHLGRSDADHDLLLELVRSAQ